MSTKKIQIKIITATEESASELISKLDEYQKELYPADSNHLLSISELEAPDCKLFGAFMDSKLVGIGACKFCDGYAELKRFYVDLEQRGSGIGRLIFEEIEKLIRVADLPLARLETGVRQIEALNFYKKLGFKERGPFGTYNEDPLSVFMEKIIL